MGRLRIGEVLLADGLIGEFQLQTALGEQTRWGNRLGETLVHLGFLGEQELVRALTRRFALPGVDLEGKRVDPEVLALVPREVAEAASCLPLFVQRERGIDVLYVGMDDPSDLAVVDDLSFRTGLRVRPVVAGPLQLRRAIASHYGGVGATPSLQGRRVALAEASLPPEDTAPLLPEDARPVLEPPPPSEEPGPAPPARPPEPPAAETAGAAGADAPRDAAASDGGDEAEAADRPRQVPTRDILRALVHLLIEREIVSREDLMKAVQEVAREAPSAGGAANGRR